MQSGHVLIGGRGELLSIDRGFSTIMQALPASLIGRHVLDVTAPADREECSTAIARLRATGQSFEISKRFIRDDGSLIWVNNTVSIVDHGRDADLIVATVTPLVQTTDRAPARLLDAARLLAQLQIDRAERFRGSLKIDMPWSLMLAAYIAEAEGRAISAAGIAAQFGVTQQSAERWIAILLAARQVEIETREQDPCAAKSFRLTATAHLSVEDHLSLTADAYRGDRTARAASGCEVGGTV